MKTERDSDLPRIVADTAAYLIAYKPAGMHSAPLREGEEDTLVSWCAREAPEIAAVRGRKEVERGLLHRLDRETAGLVAFAKTDAAYRSVLDAQDAGLFIKEYRAICVGPVPPTAAARETPFTIESAFLAFGPGRKTVRAVPVDANDTPAQRRRLREAAFDRGAPYRTEVLGIEAPSSDRPIVRAQLLRGFRHQIRCHLAWIGLPIAGDPLYGVDASGSLALTAVALSFPDPETGALVRYVLDSSQEAGGRS
jgi:23S rRNA pseudouridine1911/1915/1917 synthase